MNLSKRELVLAGLIIVLVAVNIGLILRLEGYDKNSMDTNDLDSYFAEEVEYSSAEIVVHITGQVRNSGVFYISKGARAIDAINAAGGALEEADLDSINLARVVQDGEKLHVPAAGEIRDNNIGLGYEGGGNATIDINTASASQLETLPGIGPVLAGRIVDFREREGRFQKKEDIMKVSGIGPKVYENLKESITVR